MKVTCRNGLNPDALEEIRLGKVSNGKSTAIEIKLWYRDDDDRIRIKIPGQSPLTVSRDPNSKRGNPKLYEKLADCLKEAGKPHPTI